MRTMKWVPTTLQAPGMRRVLEAVRRLDSELSCWDDKETEKPLKQERRNSGQERLLQ